MAPMCPLLFCLLVTGVIYDTKPLINLFKTTHGLTMSHFPYVPILSHDAMWCCATRCHAIYPSHLELREISTALEFDAIRQGN